MLAYLNARPFCITAAWIPTSLFFMPSLVNLNASAHCCSAPGSLGMCKLTSSCVGCVPARDDQWWPRSFSNKVELIMHKDIAPNNIVRSRTSTRSAKYARFRHVRQAWVWRSHDTSYPELLGGSKHYSKMVDMWAAGTVAAEMDRGTSVFTGDAEPEALSRMISVLDRPTFSPMAEDITGIMKEATLVVGHPPKKLARRRRTRPVRRFL